jgi:magnesium chelatase accessory protein
VSPIWDRGARLRWETDGRDWPGHDSSRFVRAAGLRWHVQISGSGPAAFLVHGTGAATHTWRGLAPLLATSYRVVACDLPGHGFSDPLPRGRVSLPRMAEALAKLLVALDVRPGLAIGHSAGAAILARMCLDRAIQPRALVSLNGALLRLAWMPMELFTPLARLFAASAVVPRLVAWRATDRAAVVRLVGSTGSHLEPRGVDLYARLVRNPAHVGAALDMMAGWDLAPLERDLPTLRTPLLMVVGSGDKAVPADEGRRVCQRVPAATLRVLPGLGHLAHEEDPRAVAKVIREFGAAL